MPSDLKEYLKEVKSEGGRRSQMLKFALHRRDNAKTQGSPYCMIEMEDGTKALGRRSGPNERTCAGVIAHASERKVARLRDLKGILEEHHVDPAGPHHRVDAMFALIQQSWENVPRFLCECYVSACMHCKHTKRAEPAPPAAPLQDYPANFPKEIIQWDSFFWRSIPVCIAKRA